MMERRIAILYICTGYYDVFFEAFYKSCEAYFLPNSLKHYFVFTDSQKDWFRAENITKIYQENLGWPDNTLKRFHMFDRISEELAEYDYIFFFNANVEFMMPIKEDILPENGLIAVLHPGYYNKPRERFTYETNPQSLACISAEEGEVYVCGGVNGGTASAYLEMIKELKRRIDVDESNGIIALWHDESHWNRYIIGRNDVTLLGPDYCYPDLYDLTGYVQRIRIRWKQAVIKADIWKLRGVRPSLQLRITEFRQKRKMKEYLAKRETERQEYLKTNGKADD